VRHFGGFVAKYDGTIQRHTRMTPRAMRSNFCSISQRVGAMRTYSANSKYGTDVYARQCDKKRCLGRYS
jgi:hypothetical protein